METSKMPFLPTAVLLLLMLNAMELFTGAQNPVELKMFSAPLSWNDAHLYCQSQNMTLAYLDQDSNMYMRERMQEDDFVQTVNDDFWIGIFDSIPSDESKDDEGYAWANTCRSLSSSWTNWKSGEPQNTADSFCVAMFKDSDKWKLAKCEEKRPFLCSRPAAACQYIQANKNTCSFQETSTQTVDRTSWDGCQEACETVHSSVQSSSCWWFMSAPFGFRCILSYGDQAPVCSQKGFRTYYIWYMRSCVSFSLETDSIREESMGPSNMPQVTCPPSTTSAPTELPSAVTALRASVYFNVAGSPVTEPTQTAPTNEATADTSSPATAALTTVTTQATRKSPTSRSTADTRPPATTALTTHPTGEVISPSNNQHRLDSGTSSDGPANKLRNRAYGNGSSVNHNSSFSGLRTSPQLQPTSAAAPGIGCCICAGQSLTPPPLPSPHQLNRSIVRLREELTVNVDSLSSTRRRKESASDSRSSSMFIATVCMAALFASLGALFLMDVPLVLKDLKKGVSVGRQRQVLLPVPELRP